MTKWRQNITVYFKSTRLCGHCWPSWPILPLNNEIKIVSDIGRSAISAWDCHLIYDNDICLLSTAAMKCLHWSLFCQKILSENFRTYFPSTFCKRTSFQSAFFNKDEFSLGPVFLIPELVFMSGDIDPFPVHIAMRVRARNLHVIQNTTSKYCKCNLKVCYFVRNIRVQMLKDNSDKPGVANCSEYKYLYVSST